MSTLQFEQTDNIITVSGDLTFDCAEMMNELGDINHMFFGDISKGLADHKFGNALDDDAVNALQNQGTTMDYYNSRKVFCYLCVRPSDYANYMFSPMDSENRDNEFTRLRKGVKFFHAKGFNVYIVD